MNGLIVIIDSETEYANKLSNYISKRVSGDYDVRVFKSIESLKEINIAALVSILSEEIIEGYEIVGGDGSDILGEKIILSKDQASCNTFKYQSADVIFKIVLERINELEEAIITRKSLLERQGINVLNEQYKSRNDCGNNSSRKRNTVSKELKTSIKAKTQDRLLEENASCDEEILRVIDGCIDDNVKALTASEKSCLRNEVFYSIRGLDVLEELLLDDSITEIMVNGEQSIFFERKGRIVNSGKSFDSREQLNHVIQKIVAYANRTVNLMNPICDARLPNGSRVNVVLDPISIDGPTLTIRRFPENPLTIETLMEIGAISNEAVSMLRKLVYAGYNILVSGSTGSGKTTFLNILTSFIPKDERIITIEDSAELKIMGIDNLVRLETRNRSAAKSDGCEEISIRDLIRAALRMRPDRVIVGEVRGEEAIDMLQAFSVGQDGSMSTIHANSAFDALYRLEMLMMLGKIEMPLAAIRRQISLGVDVIIHLGRLKDKTRKVLEIREVVGIEDGEIKTELLFRFENGIFVKYGEIKNQYKLLRAGC